MMNQPITVRFTPSQDDYARVLRLFFWQRTSMRISLVILALAFGMIVYTTLSQPSTPSIFQIVWLLLPPLFVIYVFLIQPRRMASQAIRNEQLVSEATWQVSNSGVDITNRFGTTKLEWDTLDRLVRTGEYYLLLSKVNRNAFRFIPLRAFPSQAEKDQFIELVSEYLPKSKP